jgi:hypothetical protein
MVNGYGYWDQVKRALPANCSADIISAVQYTDDALGGSNTSLALEVTEIVLGDGGGESPLDVGAFLQTPFWFFQVCDIYIPST